jgi:hypothetical protein
VFASALAVLNPFVALKPSTNFGEIRKIREAFAEVHCTSPSPSMVMPYFCTFNSHNLSIPLDYREYKGCAKSQFNPLVSVFLSRKKGGGGGGGE